jgi:hypothetical protein
MDWTGINTGILALATTIPGLTGRVTQGYVRFPDNSNWEQSIQALTPYTQGAFCFDRVSGRLRSMDVGTLEFEGELAVSVPKDTSTDMVQVWLLADALHQKLVSQSAWDSQLPNCVPDEVEVTKDQIEILTAGGIAHFRVRASFIVAN